MIQKLIIKHWNIYNDTTSEPTAIYLDGLITRWLDNEYSNFGMPCNNCGQYYNNTMSLVHGSQVGGYNGLPRADGGSGCDHREVLVDMLIDLDI